MGLTANFMISILLSRDGTSVLRQWERAVHNAVPVRREQQLSNSWILYEYDELSRLSQRRVGEVLEEHYSYLPGSESGTTTTLPETYYTTAKGSSTKLSGYRYAYDARNNITRITDLKNNSYWSYAYDEVGQLRYATTYNASGVAQDRYKYYYDRAGNLTSWKLQDGTGGYTGPEHTYTYGNSEWKDLLTAYDGHTITYDVNGNPLSYYNGKSYSMSWRNGRELEQVKVGGKTYRYEYDGNGQRTRKSNEDGGYTEYYLVDGLAVAERRYYAGGSERYTMRYLYDESNSPVGLGLKYPGESLWTYFYFEKNVQGDVIGLYRSDYSSSRGYYGTLVARYSYDPYGRPVSMTNASGTTISQTAYNVAAYNPFRYRGYRYDGETGLYYLQSRYYDPETCRFINMDKFASTGQGLIGINMFAYCNNNPVCYVDEHGDAARPVTMSVNDGAYGSCGLASPGSREADLLEHHANNSSYRGETEDAVSVVATAYQDGTYTKDYIPDFTGTLAVSGVASAAAKPISLMLGLAIKSANIVSFATFVLVGGISYALSMKNVPVGTYEKFAVVTVERYPITTLETGESAYKLTTRTTYYIDKVIGIDHEWRQVGTGFCSERWVIIPWFLKINLGI